MRGVHSAITQALQAIAEQKAITRIVEETGHSHRQFLGFPTQKVPATRSCARRSRVTRPNTSVSTPTNAMSR